MSFKKRSQAETGTTEILETVFDFFSLEQYWNYITVLVHIGKLVRYKSNIGINRVPLHLASIANCSLISDLLACPSGYEVVGRTCTDIDECATGVHTCEQD